MYRTIKNNLYGLVITFLVSSVLCISGCGSGGGSDGGGGIITPVSSEKAITAFSFTSLAATGTINENAKTIAVTVPYGTNVTALIATFSTTGASVMVGSSVQVSGTTPNDFTSTVVYTVTAADGTTAAYTVTVTKASSTAKAITAFSFTSPPATGTVDEHTKTIAVTVPFGTNVTSLIATFSSTGMSVEVGSTDQVSGTTPNDFTNPVAYTVTAADGTTATYTVTVYIAPSSAKVITAFSFASLSVTGVINDSAKTITATVPYGTNVTALIATFSTTGALVTVGTTTQASGTTPNNFTTPVVYTVTAADGTTATYTVTVYIAPSSAKAITAFSFASLSATGVINEGAKTIAVTVPYGTNVTALIATFSTTGALVTVGSTTQVSGTTQNDFTTPKGYTVKAADSSTATYTVTVTVALNSAKAITAYSFASLSATGVINEGAKTIAVTVPYGTNVTALIATFSTTGASVKIGSTVQVSGTTPNNFTTAKAYMVTAADSSTATYTVTVTVALNSAKAITSFSFPSTSTTGTINESAKTIAATVPYGTNVTALIATFSTTGASVKVGSTVQVSGTTPNNFTSPVAYTVTAADSSTATYTVTVTVSTVDRTATLDWNAVTTDLNGDPLTELTGYRVYFGTAPGTYGAPIEVGNVTTYVFNNITPPGTYYFSVTAYNSGGESAYAIEQSKVIP